MKFLPRLTALIPLLLTACSHGTVNLTSFPSNNLPTSALTEPQTRAQSTSLPQMTEQIQQNSSLTKLQLEPIALEAISHEVVVEQIELRKQSALPENSPQQAELSQTEINKIKQLEASLLKQIRSEDQAHAEQNPEFRTQSLQGGEDVDIELFLYHPTYGKRAKSWGIDTAKEFLMAGKSPTRRWLLRLKLEGLFAPKNFKYQVLFWVEQADLLRVSGIDREMAWLLAANGITSVPDLARRTNSFEQIALLTSLKLMAFQNGFDQPSSSDLENWVNEAKTLEPIIY